MRIRLGAPLAAPGTPCVRCGFAFAANTCTHCLLCALPEATRGHFDCRDCVLELAHLADPSSQTEVEGLVPSTPLLRPADILSSAALPGRLAALDVGITSPDAGGAGLDCCARMHSTKIKRYAPFLEELENQGVTYAPVIWSAWGRAHPETECILLTLAKAAARRRGLRDHRQLLRRTNAAVGVVLVRRAVRMCRSCLESPEPAELDGLLRGRSPLGDERRTVQLVDGDAEAT